MTTHTIRFHCIRHTECENGDPDKIRPLTEKGTHHAKSLGNALRQQGIREPLVLSSTATRAAETARAAWPRMNVFSQEEFYFGGPGVASPMRDAHHDLRPLIQEGTPMTLGLCLGSKWESVFMRYAREARRLLAQFIGERIADVVLVGHTPQLQAIAYELTNGRSTKINLLDLTLAPGETFSISVPRGDLFRA